MAKQASTNVMYIATSASGRAALFRKLPATAGNGPDVWMPLSQLDADTVAKISKKEVPSGAHLYITAPEYMLRDKGLLGPVAK